MLHILSILSLRNLQQNIKSGKKSVKNPPKAIGSLARALGMGVSGFLYGFEFHSPFLAGSVLMLGSLGLFFVYRSRQAATA